VYWIILSYKFLNTLPYSAIDGMFVDPSLCNVRCGRLEKN
jgi:hypothetical protein